MVKLILDIRTIYFIGCLLYVILPVITWLVLKADRSMAVRAWCGGSFIFGLGWIFLTLLRGIVPDVFSFTVANVLIFSSFLIRTQSLRLNFQTPAHWRLSAIASVLFGVIFHALWRLDDSGDFRVIFSTTGNTMTVVLFAWVAWRLGRRHDSFAARGIAAIYGILGVVGLWRLALLTVGQTTQSLLNATTDVYFLSVGMILGAVVGHLGFLGIVVENSTRRRVETAAQLAREEESRRLAIQLAQFDRQRGIAELSSSLAHELTQPLTAILSNAQTAKRGIRGDRLDKGQLTDLLARIEFNSRRANDIVKRIRSFIRPQTVDRKQVDLGRIVQETIDLIGRESLPAKVTVSVEKPKDPVWVQGDAIQLSQIVVNLFRNALDAVMNNSKASRRDISLDVGLRLDRAILTVRDNGPGFTREAMEQTGTPFFSTKENGLGMGLAISRAIAEQHGGRMSFHNGVDRGAVFEISLPVLDLASGGTS
ncbi:MAG TPA: GHKL domain-containing protein [Rhodospirillaceae bacterium]|nr:GHKL domain-containing protein [Rhodospirillaceae bacterium]